MFGHWYNSSIRQYCLLLGDLFSHVQVMRRRGTNINLIKVPISYSSKERFISKLNSTIQNTDSNDSIKIETILPRMSLNLLDITYTPERKTNISNRAQVVGKTSSTTISQFNPTPVKFIFEVGVYTRHLDDLYQIIEQILPYFQPHFSTKITELSNQAIEIERDVNITFQSIDIDDNVESDNLSRRRIQANLIFEVNGWIYPPSCDTAGKIKTVYVDLFSNSKTLGEKTTFESIDTQISPLDVSEENWDGSYIQTSSSNKQIPTGNEPSKPR